MKVADACNTDIDVLPRDATAQQAAAMMGDLSARALVVGSAEAPAGIVTDRDLLLRLVAHGMDPKATPVSEIMSTELYTCGPDDDLDTTLAEMARRQIRRAAVLDPEGRLVGLLEASPGEPAA
jgi:CBS domain-containing protein